MFPTVSFLTFSTFFKINFYWSIVSLQCCVSFYCTAKWISSIISPPFWTSSHSGHRRALSRVPYAVQSALSLLYAENQQYTLFSSVQSLSRVRLFATPWIAAHQASLSITSSWSSLRLTSIESVIPSSHLILGHPLLLLPPIPPSIRVFSNESSLRIRWPEYWSFSFNISPSNEHSGLISFRMDWMDLLAVQGTLKSPPAPQCESISSSALCLLYCPPLTSVRDYWKNHSLD